MQTNQFQLLKTALDLKANLLRQHLQERFRIDKTMVGLSVEMQLRSDNSSFTAAQTALDLKKQIASPTLQELFQELIKQWLDWNVDNTSDANKPVSQQRKPL
jgi:hypothetical protein